MSRHSIPVLLLALLVLPVGCRSKSTPPAPSPERSDTPSPADSTDTILGLIEKLEADRSLGDGKLERYLADPDARIRARAALALGRIGDPKALLQLVPPARAVDGCRATWVPVYSTASSSPPIRATP